MFQTECLCFTQIVSIRQSRFSCMYDTSFTCYSTNLISILNCWRVSCINDTWFTHYSTRLISILSCILWPLPIVRNRATVWGSLELWSGWGALIPESRYWFPLSGWMGLTCWEVLLCPCILWPRYSCCGVWMFCLGIFWHWGWKGLYSREFIYLTLEFLLFGNLAERR